MPAEDPTKDADPIGIMAIIEKSRSKEKSKEQIVETSGIRKVNFFTWKQNNQTKKSRQSYMSNPGQISPFLHQPDQRALNRDLWKNPKELMGAKSVGATTRT
ncbi:hypothetical protein Tsubulata_004678 [Turnera subulata]|uniref:Uncharacterized protein n=1 Tax=Turnera subulata TaxID=218843 RepID=A0A9Q0JAX4_9ROSI|nr:hypothetical protein Tsubulata_004678 [Turnera subulata]